MSKCWATAFNKKLRPITEAQKRYHAKVSAKYLFIDNENGDCTCPKCGKQLHLGKTKHKSKLVCPNCTNKLIVQHTWRMSKYLETINWMVIPKTINNHVLCLRYVLAYQVGNNSMKVSEEARMFIDEYHAEPEYYYQSNGKWFKGKTTYFRTPCYLAANKFWCMNAYEYPRNFFKEIDKMDCFKYYSSQKEYDFSCFSSQLLYQIRSARLNEKLSKVGLNKLVEGHRHFFCTHNDRCYSINYKATSLIDMLKLDKPRFNILKKHGDYTTLDFLQREKNLNLRNFEVVGCSPGLYKKVNEIVYKTSISFTKIASYLNGVNYHEYTHYLDNLEKLGYNLSDTYYSLPKDFKEADRKITIEYMEKYEKEKLEKQRAKDTLIKNISDGIRNMSGLKEFLNGSEGLLVYVPESARDLIEEGKAMNNCIGTYVDRIAEGKTLVFFVRQLNNPTAPFVAFEYHNGKVVQCMYKRNEKVEDTKILDFVNRFANVLKAS